jgi:hypothetical protein
MENLNNELTYEEQCEIDAGKTYYYEVDGVPVKKEFSEDGTYSLRYGLKDGKWLLDYPSDSLFMNEGTQISKDRFESLTKKQN